MHNHHRPLPEKGFSLLEVLVVLGIISIVMAFALPAFNSIGRSQGLTGALTATAEGIENARRTAITANRMVQFRVRESEEGGVFVSFDSVAFDEFGRNPQPVGRAVNLPQGLLFHADESSILNDLPSQTSPPPESVRYRSICFMPDGSTDLTDTKQWYLVIAHESALSNPESADLGAVSIDPTTGAVSTHRP